MNPINLLDLKWYESQVMADTPDGGGLITGREVPEGNILGIFPNVSSQQLVTGGVNLRQLYAGLFSPDTNTLSGSGVVIIEPPMHQAVNVLLFGARPGEVRADAEQRIESYLIPGVQTTWRLLQEHPQGQSVLTLWALPATPGFQVGDTLILDHLGRIEPARIERINARTTTRFSDASGVFELDILELILTRGIEQDLPGEAASRFTANKPVTAVKRTTVSRGAHYYGIAALTQAITAGDLSVQVASLEAPVVPATTAETPIVDSRASLSKVVMVATGAQQGLNVVVPVVVYSANEPKSVYLGSPFLPGSLTLSGTFSGVDDGKGLVNLDQPGVTATCSYATGEITFTATSNGQTSITLTATAAAPVAQSNQTRRIAVTPQSRASTYVLSMTPFPAPGSVAVDYRALGRWYRLSDRGDGVLQGQLPNEGSGSVNFATGSAAINLPLQPDVGSEVIYSWGTGVQVSDGRAEITPESPEIRHQLAERHSEPGSIVITYNHNGNPLTLSDDGQGNLVSASMAVVGRVAYPTSELALRPPQWPDVGATIQISHDVGAAQSMSFQPSVGQGESGPVSVSLGQAIRPRSVRFEWLVENQQDGRFFQDTVAIVDDGAGGFHWSTDGVLNGDPVAGALVDYATGVASFPTTAQLNIQQPTTIVFDTTDENGQPITVHQVTGFVTQQFNWFLASGGTITARFKADSVVDQNRTETINAPVIEIDLSPTSTHHLAPNSLRFTLNGRTYIDRAGVLLHSIDPLTNAGTAAGTVNYQTGQATLSEWVAGNQNLTLVSLGLSSGVTPVSALYFRTDSAPNKQGALSLRANVLDTGELLQGSADINGLISGDRMLGRFDAELGIVAVRFGAYVAAAGNELEWWYQADQVQQDGTIWRPTLITPGSAFFNTVAFSTIPVPSFILGLDPILLPQTGRVPIFQSGDIVLVHRLATLADAAPVAGALLPLDLPAINWLRVQDANGMLVASDRYTLDDTAVGLRWLNPLDLSEYTAPFTVQGFYYVQALVNEAQINGQISLNFPLPYDLPADGKTYLSSKLPFNPTDLSARATNIFTQETWTGIWLDGPDGSVTAGQFDDVNYPPIVTNQGAITERWRLQFSSNNTVNVIGEQTGQVATQVSIFNDIAPMNPAHGVPFFVIPALGFSQGFVQGNVLRLDTVGAHSGVWFLRSIQPSTVAVGNDGVTVALIGDGDPA